MAFLAVCALFTVLGAILAVLAPMFRVAANPLIDRIDQLLPQTQCGQCGFGGCRPYAEAIAKDTADIDRCPPGGEQGVKALAGLLGLEPKPLDPRGRVTKLRSVATIEEHTCIGCSLCIQACPVDAIVGAPKLMHTVIASECTGCELCLPPCPVDCIIMAPIEVRPMRDSALPGENVPTIEGANSIPFAVAAEFPDSAQAQPCIRCGACAEVCPVNLVPQQLYWYSRSQDLQRAQEHHLVDCTECRGCDTVCPSRIPLARTFRAAKSQIMASKQQRALADHARRRFQAGLARKERDIRQREEAAKRKREALTRPDAAEIAQAIARAEARKQAAPPSGGSKLLPVADGVPAADDPTRRLQPPFR